MHSHPNAFLAQKRRLSLVAQHLEHGRSLVELAAETGTESTCAAPARGSPVTAQAVQPLWRIARLLRAPFSTVASTLSRLGLGRLRNLEPWRLRKVGRRITGDRQQGRSTGVGYDKVHVAVNDAIRLADVSRAFAKACPTIGLRHIPTGLYKPRSNGKAERFIQTLCREWAYAMADPNSSERNRWLPRYLAIENRLRKHVVLGWRTQRPPVDSASFCKQQRLTELLR